MKILLINPPIKFIEGQGDRPPLGLAYLAANLLKNGKEHVKILDLSTKPNFSLPEYLLQEKPDIVAISSMTPTFFECAAISKICKDTLKGIITVAGGPHPSSLPEQTLKESDFDIVIYGEGEVTFDKLIDTLENKGNLKDVQGLYYNEEGKILSTEPRQLQENIDMIPFPARHLLNMEEYTMKIQGLPATTIITSRGCPFSCVYCNKSVFGNKFRARSPRNIVDEIKEITKTYGIKAFLFVDDTFTYDYKRTEGICDLIIKEKLGIIWRCWTRSDKVDKNLIKKMYEAGCTEMSFGIESGNQQVLNKIRKGTLVEQNEKAIKWAREMGIYVKAFFMIGLPGESMNTVKDNLEFIKKADPNNVDFYIMTPFPSTKVWDDPESLGIKIVSKDWRSYFHAGKEGATHSVVATEHMSRKEIDLAYEWIVKEYEKIKNSENSK